MSKYGVFSGAYFPVFSPNIGIYGPEKTPYLDTFHLAWLERYIQLSFKRVYKPKIKKNRRIEWKIFQGCFKNKKEKNYLKRLSFITQFKIEFLLPFTSCRKVLGKMLGKLFWQTASYSTNSK